MKSVKRWTMAAAVAGLVLAMAPAAHAGLVGQLGILDTSGINPATGVAWALGDTYRFAFVSSESTQAYSNDITTYDLFLQDLANASELNIGADEGVTWYAIASTPTVDARDNTGTNPEEDGAGVGIFLLDGVTIIADSNAHLWDGTIDNKLDIHECGVGEYTKAVHTGTNTQGKKSGPLGEGHGKTMAGHSGFSTSKWIQFSSACFPHDHYYLYAMSSPLHVVPEPATLALMGLGGLGLVLGRKRR